MKTEIFYSEFFFTKVKFSEFHYTDSRAGSPLNYLAYMVKGTAKIVSENKTIHIKEGDVFYIPRDLPYQSYWYGEKDIDFLSFGALDLHINKNTNFDLQVIPCGDEITNMIKSIPTPGTNVDFEALGMYYSAMNAVYPLLKRTEKSGEERIVEGVKSRIKANPHASMPEIAKTCSISEPYLYMLFKKVTGMTPNDYRQLQLCKVGVELLITTDKKIEDISSILNFSSSSYFRKVIKKHTGKTPKEIRKNMPF